nr:hypothetical protein [Streptomyces lunaelactis]
MVVSLVAEDDSTAETALRGALALRYNTVKPFLSLLGEPKALDAATGGMRILTGVKRLPALSRRKVSEKPLLPREVDEKLVPPHWRKAVYANADLPEGAVDRDASGDAAIDVSHELAMATLHLLAARKQLRRAESCRSTSDLVKLCDQVQGPVSEIRALRRTRRPCSRRAP